MLAIQRWFWRLGAWIQEVTCAQWGDFEDQCKVCGKTKPYYCGTPEALYETQVEVLTYQSERLEEENIFLRDKIAALEVPKPSPKRKPKGVPPRRPRRKKSD